MERKAREWWNAWSDQFQSEGDVDVAVAFGPGAPPGDDLGPLGVGVPVGRGPATVVYAARK